LAIMAGSSLLDAVGGALLLSDAVKSGASTGIAFAAGLGLVGWLVVAAAFATACMGFLGLTRDRVATFRATTLVGAAGFSTAFLSELASVVDYFGHGARGTFVAAHGAFGVYDLLATLACATAAVALARGGRSRTSGANRTLGWASVIASVAFLMLAVGSLLYLVTYSGAGATAGNAGVGAQIVGSALAAGGALIVATAFLAGGRGRSRRRSALGAGAGMMALGFGIVALGGGIQAAVAGANGLDIRTTAAAWLDVARQVGWAAGLLGAALGSARGI
jgi:hypothetical protein